MTLVWKKLMNGMVSRRMLALKFMIRARKECPTMIIFTGPLAIVGL
jgi:hypothetical protein